MIDITVIFPAARLREQAQAIVNRLWENSLVKQVVVTSPDFEVERAWCIRDPKAGSSRAIAQAYAQIDKSATHIAWLSDICYPAPFALDKMADFIEHQSSGPFIAEFRTMPPVTIGHYRVCTIAGKQYARWGMLSRETIDRVGGFFDEAYVAHYGDVDLSLRCWKVGGSVVTCKDAEIEMRGHCHVNTAPASEDESAFLARWTSDYPTMRRDNTAEWNVDREIPC